MTGPDAEPADINPFDREHMGAALGLARRNLGQTWPNPAVGCVLVRPDLDAGGATENGAGAGRVVGRGCTQPSGRPHAETQALEMAGDLARGATAYVTLEPCSHHGKTPPCADALIAAGIKRAVVATQDPDPRVSGSGLDKLRDAGIHVVSGVRETEARALNRGFISRLYAGRPVFTLKLATSLDGKIATRSGHSQWITGPAARNRAHLMRARHDGILVGSGTVLADNPSLTCRLPGLERASPVRIVLDTRGRIFGESGPEPLKLLNTSQAPTWVLSAGPPAGGTKNHTEQELRQITCPTGEDGHLDPLEVAHSLAAQGLTRVMIEGGGAIAAAFLRAGLIDTIAWFRAPSVIGDDGIGGVAALALETVGTAPQFKRVSAEKIGQDLLEILVRDGDSA